MDKGRIQTRNVGWVVIGQVQAPYQLDGCHVLFPPKVGLGHGAKGRQSIVQVHDDMHRGVYHGRERALFS